MIVKLFSTYDVLSRIYSAPFASPTDSSAKRTFINAMSSPDYKLVALDTDLYWVGSINTETGAVTGNDFPVFVLSYRDYCESLNDVSRETIANEKE